MGYIKAVVLGALAGLIGAGTWAAIAYFTEYEVGWIAWGIGALVGIAIRTSTRPEVVRTGDASEDAIAEIRAESDQLGPGALALVLAVIAVLLGKYLTVAFLINNVSVEFNNDDLLISSIADEVVAEYEANGRALEWPLDVDPRNPASRQNYPSDAWTEAAARWGSMSPEEQARFREETVSHVARGLEENVGSVFLSSFGPADFLWFGLAAWTAFKLGASGSEE